MLLMKLEAKEKFAFLQLAHYLARVDNEYKHKEIEIILEYCAEMGIDNDDFFNMSDFDLENILKTFKTKYSKKIVLLELMILIHADEKYDIKEEELVIKINKYFALSKKDLAHASIWGKTIASLYQQGKVFIES